MVLSELGNLVSLGVLEIRDNDLFGKLPLTMVNLSELHYLSFGGQELCAPETPEFQAWLAGLDDVYGETCNPLRNIVSHTGARIGCTGGKAAEFECKNIDLLSHLSRRDMGAESGILISDIWGWTDPESNQEYALVAKENSVAIVDVTDQVNPVYLGTLLSHDPEAVAIWRDMKVYRNHMFVVADAHRLARMACRSLTLLNCAAWIVPASLSHSSKLQIIRELGVPITCLCMKRQAIAYLGGE